MSRQGKSGTKKKREKRYAGKQDGRALREEYVAEEDTSFLQGIRGGMRGAFGAEDVPEKKAWVDYLWTALVLVVLAGVILWRYGGQ